MTNDEFVFGFGFSLSFLLKLGNFTQSAEKNSFQWKPKVSETPVFTGDFDDVENSPTGIKFAVKIEVLIEIQPCPESFYQEQKH